MQLRIILRLLEDFFLNGEALWFFITYNSQVSGAVGLTFLEPQKSTHLSFIYEILLVFYLQLSLKRPLKLKQKEK